ncbi:SusC/RagA family TonB-linked outer membrane protein [Pedobacter sp. PWIIR3]
MKLTTFLLMIALAQVSAATFAQKLTYSKQGASLKEIFAEIKIQTGYNVLYSPDQIDPFRKVNVSFKQANLDDVLNKLINAKTQEYSIVDKNILIKEKEKSSLDNLNARLHVIDVRGRVVDENGSPLIGASIKVMNGKGGATAGSDGRFVVTNVDEGGTLVISFIGFVNNEVKASADLGDVTLHLSYSKLDEVQVIAYGTTSKRLSTGNVTSIKSKDIENQPVNNPLLALQGRIPGLTITQATGYSGTSVIVRIQGQNSIRNGNNPFYIIDGTPYLSAQFPSGNILKGDAKEPAINGGNVYDNPLTYINPNDIESIEVLKDADATAIYGSRAANGAILITTKKGKTGKLDVNFNLRNGYGNVATKSKALSTPQYLELRREALKNNGLKPDPHIDYDLFEDYGWSADRSTDWQKELVGNTSSYNDLQSSISGGNEYARYYLSGTYHGETTVLPSNFSDQKGSLHLNIDAYSPNKRFGVEFSGMYLSDVNQLPGYDLASVAMTLPPNAPQLYNSDGSINNALDDNGNSTWFYTGNPASALKQRNKTVATNLLGNLSLSYKILKGLNLKSNFGYNRFLTDESSQTPKSALPYVAQADVPRTSSFRINKSTSYTIEPQLSYLTNIGSLRLETLLGGTIQNSGASSNQITATGYGSDDQMSTYAGSTNLLIGYDVYNNYNYNAIFGRLNLNFKDKYILNATARTDGSSRFGGANLYHTFASLGGAWLFSEESILKDNPYLSFGKLRLSYGTTGSDQIGNYKFLSLYGPTPVFGMPYQGINGLLPQGHSNPYLQWEETKKLQAGIDLGFFNDRFLIFVNYFRNLSSNQLLDYKLPSATGFSSVTTNFPALVRNTGWELSLTSTVMRFKELNWTANFNFTSSRNILAKFDNLETSTISADYILGRPLQLVKLFPFEGVNSATGAYQFRTVNGEVTSQPNFNVDRTVLESLDPKFYGGFQNTIGFKMISLDFHLQFVKQKGYNNIFGYYPGYFSGTTGNQPVYVLDRWQKPGDQKLTQQYDSNFSLRGEYYNATVSSAAFTDASFLRLKNITLNIQVPQAWTEKLYAKNLSIFASGQNLLTFTNYKGWDPETRSSNSLPPLRLIAFGIKGTF